MDKEDKLNFNTFEGKNIDPEEVIELARTLPFFAEHRLILLENTGFFKKACDELTEFVPEIPESAILLFVEDEVDKRTKFYKTVKKYGRIVEFKRQKEKDLEKWVLGRIKKENSQITSQALSLFFNKTGVSMENIASELEKLICYTINKGRITAEDVMQICTEQTENRIFEMINAIAGLNQKKALDLYYDLLTLKEQPLRILALLTRQFRILYQVKELLRLGRGREEIARLTSLHSFVVGKYIKQSKEFSASTLKKAEIDCVNTEEDIKKGRIADKLGVELLIVQFSTKK